MLNREQRRQLKRKGLRVDEKQEQKQTKIKVNGREILFPPLDLDMGEMCDCEEEFGVRWDEPRRSGVRLTAAYLWIAIRRKDPTVTVADIRAIDPSILKQLEEADASPPDETGPSEPNNSESSEYGENGSTPASDGSAGDQSPTGRLGLDTGVVSDPVTSPV